jgi:GTP cyclohydrolase I
MQDIQNSPASVQIPIDRVGLNNLQLPLVVSDRRNGNQHTVALVDLGVDLPANFKGTHMSRFVEALENWNEELSYKSIKSLLLNIKSRLEARKAYAHFRFTYFLRKKSPVSGCDSIMGYACALKGELEGDKPVMELRVEVPVMTVCPCSKAISKAGAHSQRAIVRIDVGMKGFAWIEEFVEIAEASGSSALFPLLKREDEKAVTEFSFANPCFVEDVVRHVAAKLDMHPQLLWYRVEVESLESIHAHNAFACIERHW